MLTTFCKSSYSDSQENCVEVAQALPSFCKSTYSNAYDNCVEVADLPTGAAIRDSKRPDAGHLAFPASDWAAFLRAVRSGALVS